MNSPNPYAPPRAAVSDVSDPTAPAEMADRGMRLVAYILDVIVASAMIYLPLLIGGAATGAFSSVRQGDAAGIMALYFGLGGFLGLIGFIAWLWLTILYVSRNGQTIGKKMLGIKVVRTDGSKASLSRIFWLRNFVNGLLTIIPLYWLVDLLVIFGETHQCIHDKIADTMVVKA